MLQSGIAYLFVYIHKGFHAYRCLQHALCQHTTVDIKIYESTTLLYMQNTLGTVCLTFKRQTDVRDFTIVFTNSLQSNSPEALYKEFAMVEP